MRLYRFGAFELDADEGELRRGGVRLHAKPQTIALLVHLVERHGTLVTREEIRTLLWPGNPFLEYDQAINTVIRQTRCLLNDAAVGARYIETLPRRGYRFVAPVEDGPASVAPVPRRRSRVPIVFFAAGMVLLLWGDQARPKAATRATHFVVVRPFDADDGGDCATAAIAMRERVQYELSLLRPAGIVLAPPNGSSPAPDLEIGANVRCEGGGIRAVVSGRDPTRHIEKWTREATGDDVPGVVASATATTFVPRPYDGEPRIGTAREAAAVRAYRQAWAIARNDPARAIPLYERLVRSDPEFAEARAGLGAALMSKALALPCDNRDATMRRAQSELRKALALRADLAVAHLYLGISEVQWEHRLNAAAASLTRAAELEPAYADAYFWRAVILSALGQHDPAIANVRLAGYLDPEVRRTLCPAVVEYNARHFAAAEGEYRRLLRTDPQSVQGMWGLVMTLAAARRENEALPLLQRLFTADARLHGVPHDPQAGFWTLAASASRGLGDPPARPSYIASQLACLDPQRSRCLDALARTLTSHPYGSINAAVDPAFDGVRSDPRYARLIRAAL